MTGQPVHIHLKPDALPCARHTLIPVQYSSKEQIKASLGQDVARGIIAPVPTGTPGIVQCSSQQRNTLHLAEPLTYNT